MDVLDNKDEIPKINNYISIQLIKITIVKSYCLWNYTVKMIECFKLIDLKNNFLKLLNKFLYTYLHLICFMFTITPTILWTYS
jgi:hypothetical protein